MIRWNTRRICTAPLSDDPKRPSGRSVFARLVQDDFGVPLLLALTVADGIGDEEFAVPGDAPEHDEMPGGRKMPRSHNGDHQLAAGQSIHKFLCVAPSGPLY